MIYFLCIFINDFGIYIIKLIIILNSLYSIFKKLAKIFNHTTTINLYRKLYKPYKVVLRAKLGLGVARLLD
jgi:hypothetical protein